MKILKYFLVVFMALSILIIFWLNLLELTQLVRAEERIRFVKLIKNEDIRDRAMSGLYYGLKVDYCLLTNYKESVLIRYTLNWDVLDDIEVLFASSLKEHPDWPRLECDDRE